MFDFFQQLQLLEDPRTGNRKVYPLAFLLYCILISNMAGARSWYQIQDYCSDYIDEINEFYRKIMKTEKDYPAPSHDTLNKCVAILGKELFQSIKYSWIDKFFPELGEEFRIIDGKTLRGVKKQTFDNECHVVSAYDPSTKITIAEEYVTSKKGELTGIKELISKLELANSLVTIDSLGCQLAIAEAITEKDGKYLLQLKSNQKNTLLEVKELFEKQDSSIITCQEDIETGHGRVEKRVYKYITDTELLSKNSHLKNWKNLKTVVICCKNSFTKSNKSTDNSIRYYLSSEENPEKVIKAIRKHWAIENNLHYCLDVYFDQDASTKRAGNAAQNMDVIQKMVLSLAYYLKDKWKSSIPRVLFRLSHCSPARIHKLLS